MKIFFALFIVMFLAFSGYHLTFRKIKLPLFARRFYLTGTEYLFLGLMLGPQFLNLLDETTCRGLAPFGALLLGWIGLLFGFQFEIAKMRRIPIEYFGSALLEGGVTFGVVFGGIVFLAPLFISLDANFSSTFLITVGLGIGAAAVCTAQTGLALLAPKFISNRSKTVQLLTIISTFDGFIAMFLLGIAYIYGGSFNEVMGERTVLFQGPIFGIFACVCLFVLYNLMMVRRCEDNELLLIVIGMAILSSGAAAMLGFSPLITNFILGVGLVNFSREKERIFRLLMNIEKPVYLILLVFLGVSWQLNTPWVFLLAGGLCLVRIFGKGLGGGLMTRFLPQPHHHQNRIGFGLIDSGGLPLAILFDFQQRFSHSMTAYIVSIGLLMVLYNDLLSPHFISYLFKRERV
jgi:sodium/hydrogen exchanger family protein